MSSRPVSTPFARTFLAYLLFLGLPFAVHAGGRKTVDFTNYELPLHEQVTNRIKMKVMARVGPAKSTRDRYFMIPFAYENKGNDPLFSHSFISVIHVLPDVRQPRLTKGLEKRTYQNRNFEAFTISWLPRDFAANPKLRLFEGFGSMLFPKRNTAPSSIGKSFNLEETVALAVNAKNALCMWGPYEIKKEGFDIGVKRLDLLNQGSLKYRADDRLTRKAKTAVNCFHAMAGLDELFPNGGFFGTGYKMWGVNGTTRVLIEYTRKPVNRALLLEPVDEKKDRFGFVYAPARQNRGIYNPFKTASAYCK